MSIRRMSKEKASSREPISDNHHHAVRLRAQPLRDWLGLLAVVVCGEHRVRLAVDGGEVLLMPDASRGVSDRFGVNGGSGGGVDVFVDELSDALWADAVACADFAERQSLVDA